MIRVFGSCGLHPDSSGLDFHPFVQSFTRHAVIANGVLFKQLKTEDLGHTSNPFKANRERLHSDSTHLCLVLLLTGSLSYFLVGKGNREALAEMGLAADEFVKQLFRAWDADDEVVESLTKLLSVGQQEPGNFGLELHAAIFEHGYGIQDGSLYKRFDWEFMFQGMHLEFYRNMLEMMDEEVE